MALLTGPCFSTDASGTIGKMLTFAGPKGHRHARRCRLASHRPQPAQRGTQVLCAALSRQWQRLSDAQRATWNDAYPNSTLTPYQAFIRFNFERIAHLHGPTQTFPPASLLEDCSPGRPTLEQTARNRDLLRNRRPHQRPRMATSPLASHRRTDRQPPTVDPTPRNRTSSHRRSHRPRPYARRPLLLDRTLHHRRPRPARLRLIPNHRHLTDSQHRTDFTISTLPTTRI